MQATRGVLLDDEQQRATARGSDLGSRLGSAGERTFCRVALQRAFHRRAPPCHGLVTVSHAKLSLIYNRAAGEPRLKSNSGTSREPSYAVGHIGRDEWETTTR